MHPLRFEDTSVHARLNSASRESKDAAGFGIIQLSAEGVVTFYSRHESLMSGLSVDTVVGRGFFTEVAPCMNNFMVAHKFSEPAELDETLDYVFTLRMRPTKVKLRLLMSTQLPERYVLVKRSQDARPR